ncbi:hypothetical protein GBA52_020273, partial [Prunus armeniaca]
MNQIYFSTITKSKTQNKKTTSKYRMHIEKQRSREKSLRHPRKDKSSTRSRARRKAKALRRPLRMFLRNKPLDLSSSTVHYHNPQTNTQQATEENKNTETHLQQIICNRRRNQSNPIKRILQGRRE